MTDLPNIDAHILQALSPRHGLTPLEVMLRCPKGITYQMIRKRLAELASEEMIRSDVVGEPEHPVREYRAWK
jgi:DNA-binding HxlR family transcriptional regulator